MAAPNGSDGTATFRKLVAADIPSIPKSKISDLANASANAAGLMSAEDKSKLDGMSSGTKFIYEENGDYLAVKVTNPTNGIYFYAKDGSIYTINGYKSLDDIYNPQNEMLSLSKTK